MIKMLSMEERKNLEQEMRDGISRSDAIQVMDNLYKLIIDDYEQRKTLIESSQDSLMEIGGFLNSPKFYLTKHAICNVNLFKKMSQYRNVSASVGCDWISISNEDYLLINKLAKGIVDSNELDQYNVLVLESDKIIDKVMLNIESIQQMHNKRR